MENHQSTIHKKTGSHQCLECKNVQGNQIESEIEDPVEKGDTDSPFERELVETDYEEIVIQSDDADRFELDTFEDPVEKELVELGFEEDTLPDICGKNESLSNDG